MIALLSLLALAAADVPTDGDLMRELHNDQDAYDSADLDGDGVISGMEFDEYKRRRAGAPEPQDFAEKPKDKGDRPGDTTLVPCEMYEEAECLGGPSGDEDGETAPEDRDDGYYYIDDRDGTVYHPDY